MSQNDTKNLTPNQRKALDALLSTTTVSKAALACGLSERTLWRYLADDTFKTALRDRQDATIKATTAALVGLSGEAIQALHDLLIDTETPSAVKARVALGWLDHTRKTVELDDLAQRVADLEAVLTAENGDDD
jgi:phage terminase small subunit